MLHHQNNNILVLRVPSKILPSICLNWCPLKTEKIESPRVSLLSAWDKSIEILSISCLDNVNTIPPSIRKLFLFSRIWIKYHPIFLILLKCQVLDSKIFSNLVSIISKSLFTKQGEVHRSILSRLSSLRERRGSALCQQLLEKDIKLPFQTVAMCWLY